MGARQFNFLLDNNNNNNNEAWARGPALAELCSQLPSAGAEWHLLRCRRRLRHLKAAAAVTMARQPDRQWPRSRLQLARRAKLTRVCGGRAS